MECKVTCFDRVLNLVKPLPENKRREAVEIIKEYGLQDLLEFCIENGCCTILQSYTLYDGIIMWEDLDSNYWEEDYDKLHKLYDKLGITEDILDKYTNITDETIKEDIEYVLRKMCFGWDREWTDGMVDRIFNTNVINSSCIEDNICVDENIIVSALMEIVATDYEQTED